ncbi:DUF4388 domain-containing protein [Nonomuraea sp. NPDC003804]|uniref:DUF4388 domain-containing protein n=1 Tax=Nonomuraea sp. NPDC003804 TaxID=3154547 RepID=UPI0033B491CA
MPALDTLLAGLARERSTGALRVGRAGAIFMDAGRVTYMECADTPRAEDVLMASGRVSAPALRRAQREGGARLVDYGMLTKGELQHCVLGAVLDAAYFLLPVTGARPKFRPGERHWLGSHWFFEVEEIVRECARRRAQLERVWPSAEVDTAPVAPVRRPPGHRVVLSDLQWEILVHADRMATPLELAMRLGRPGYATLLAVRRLAAAGLLTRPEGTAPPLPRRVDRVPEAGPRHDPDAPALPLGPVVTADPTDVNLLLRLKKALEELS